MSVGGMSLRSSSDRGQSSTRYAVSLQIDQPDIMFQGLALMGVASSNSTLAGRDHFDLLEKLTDPSYSLTQDFITAI